MEAPNNLIFAAGGVSAVRAGLGGAALAGGAPGAGGGPPLPRRPAAAPPPATPPHQPALTPRQPDAQVTHGDPMVPYK